MCGNLPCDIVKNSIKHKHKHKHNQTYTGWQPPGKRNSRVEVIGEFLITWRPWKQVQLDGHLDWLHFDTSGYEVMMISFNARACTIVQRSNLVYQKM